MFYIVHHLERELVDHIVLVHLAGPECLRRKLRVVHGVHVPHRLQAEPSVPVVHLAALSLGVVEKVPRVELHGRLVCPQLQRPAGRGVPDLRHGPHHPFPAVDDVVGVVPDGAAAHDDDLADARADRRRRPEVQRRAGHGLDAPRRREELIIQHGVPRRVQPERVAQHVAVPLAAQVPVHVQQEVYRRRLVQRRRVHVHAQRVGPRHTVRHVRVHVPRQTYSFEEAKRFRMPSKI